MKLLKEMRQLGNHRPEEEMHMINIYPELEKKTILGFGGAFTEAAAYNYAQMSPKAKQEVLKKYFDPAEGAGYTMGRVHIGSCDFALDLYSEAYCEDLSDFNIERDKKYVIPMIKDAQKVVGDKLFLFASPWSPPAFMKDNNSLIGGGSLKKEFYPTYAAYFVKFIQAYAAEGIKIGAVTVQNEAHAVQTWESCLYTAEQEVDFAVNYLRPALDQGGLSDVKIIIWDHNRERIIDRACESFSVDGSQEAIWGMGFHWYSGDHFDAVDVFRAMYPEKAIFETELCHESSESFDDDRRNTDYAKEYISCLRHGAIGVCDWNLILDAVEGGPYHCRTTGGCAAALYYDEKTHGVITDGIYGVIKTISSEIERGDVVVTTTSASSALCEAAVKKQDGRVILFVLNTSGEEQEVNVRMNGRVTAFTLPANSLSANVIA
ncbi:MAG: glucosylceramidase [Clostridia bacterium]|nr:glucosylceramidase [Clostridia bacterium]MBQ9798254.1 glucosylceramidase [Clostridia bacterium]